MGQTSIPCDSEVRDRLAGDKPDDTSWSEYLSALHSDQDIIVEPSREDIIDDIREQLETDAPTYDDIVQAARQAIREELPVEQMGGR